MANPVETTASMTRTMTTCMVRSVYVTAPLAMTPRVWGSHVAQLCAIKKRHAPPVVSSSLSLSLHHPRLPLSSLSRGTLALPVPDGWPMPTPRSPPLPSPPSAFLPPPSSFTRPLLQDGSPHRALLQVQQGGLG